jgi:hypothetical protein
MTKAKLAVVAPSTVAADDLAVHLNDGDLEEFFAAAGAKDMEFTVTVDNVPASGHALRRYAAFVAQNIAHGPVAVLKPDGAHAVPIKVGDTLRIRVSYGQIAIT